MNRVVKMIKLVAYQYHIKIICLKIKSPKSEVYKSIYYLLFTFYFFIPFPLSQVF